MTAGTDPRPAPPLAASPPYSVLFSVLPGPLAQRKPSPGLSRIDENIPLLHAVVLPGEGVRVASVSLLEVLQRLLQVPNLGLLCEALLLHWSVAQKRPGGLYEAVDMKRFLRPVLKKTTGLK